MNVRARRRGPMLLVLLVLLSGIVTAPARSWAQDRPTVPGRMLFVRNGSIWVWSSGDASRLLKADDASYARWSPDGRQVLFVRRGHSYSDLVIYALESKAQTPLTSNQPEFEEGSPEYAAAAAWVSDPEWSQVGLIGFLSDMLSPDGTFQLWLFRDESEGAFLAPAAQFEDNIDGLSLSTDGSLAAYVVQQRQNDGTSRGGARLRDLADGVAYPLAEGENAADPCISPDGQAIALAIRDDAGMSDIFVTDRSTGQLERVTRNADASNPVWSPDGKWIAFIRMVDFEFEVWAVPMSGEGPGEPIKVFRAKGLDARSGLSWTYETGD